MLSMSEEETLTETFWNMSMLDEETLNLFRSEIFSLGLRLANQSVGRSVLLSVLENISEMMMIGR